MTEFDETATDAAIKYLIGTSNTDRTAVLASLIHDVCAEFSHANIVLALAYELGTVLRTAPRQVYAAAVCKMIMDTVNASS